MLAWPFDAAPCRFVRRIQRVRSVHEGSLRVMWARPKGTRIAPQVCAAHVPAHLISGMSELTGREFPCALSARGPGPILSRAHPVCALVLTVSMSPRISLTSRAVSVSAGWSGDRDKFVVASGRGRVVVATQFYPARDRQSSNLHSIHTLSLRPCAASFGASLVAAWEAASGFSSFLLSSQVTTQSITCASFMSLCDSTPCVLRLRAAGRPFSRSLLV